MKTLGEVLSVSVQFLKEKGHARARRLIEELIAHVLKIKRIDLYMQFDRPMGQEGARDFTRINEKSCKRGAF